MALAVLVVAVGGCGGSVTAGQGIPSEEAGWHLAAPVAAGSRSVELVYQTEECVRVPGEDRGAEAAARFEQADVETSRKAVTITVVLRPSEDSGSGSVACGTAPVAVERTVELSEPLGDRALRDGSTSPPTVVRPPP